MKFKDIVDKTANKCNVDEDDDQALEVIKLGINSGYREILKEDNLISNAKVPVIMGKATLPDNIIEVLNIEPPLLNGDKIIGRNILTSTTEKILDITYSYVPDELIKDTDEPEIAPKYHSLLITYACFSYYQFKKKLEIASAYLSAFQRELDVIRTEHYIPFTIEEVFKI